MANILLGDQNYADVDYYAPVLSGGSWSAALPLANVQNEVFSKVARSSDDAVASTRVHADLKVSRDVRLLAACNHNLSRAGQVRFRGSRQIAWSGVTLAANATAGASALTVECDGGSAMIRAGDSFTLGGVNYTATSPLAIGGNRFSNTEDMTAFPWTDQTNAITVTEDAAEAPDGATTADLITETTAANDSHYLIVDSTAVPTVSLDFYNRVTLSCFVKAAGRKYVYLYMRNTLGTGVTGTFDLELGEATVSANSALGAVEGIGGIVTLSGGWHRVWVTIQGITPAGAFSLALQAWNNYGLYLLNDSQLDTYTGDGTSGIYLWGWQLETGDLSTYKQSGATEAYQVLSGSVSITPNLAADQSAGAVLSALCGEYVSSAPAADSGWIDVWPVVYPWYLAWENPSFWDNRLTEEERRTYPKDYIHDIGATATARYWLTEFSDATNADGYVQFGRLFISRGYQPTRNYSYDDQFGWEDDTVALAAVGADYFDERARLRVFSCIIENLEEDEALTYLFETQRRLGKRGQLIVVLDPAETTHWQRKSFIARNVEITPLSNPHFNRHTVALRLKEIRRA